MKKTSEFKATDLRNVKLFCDNLYQAHLDRANNSEYSSEDDLGASIDFNELINISSSSQEKCIFAYNVYLYELIFNNYCYSFNETFNKFNVSLVKLSYIEQLIIALYYKDELTYNQISSILNISSETIFKVHSLAISKLRHCEQE
jgi:RNA polymerase sigma factor (sigma-70 family)